jgi:hypothetical protein
MLPSSISKDLSLEAVDKAVAMGYRFVFFEFCLSFLFVTIRRPSALYFLRPGDGAWRKRIGYTAVTLFCGWWGVPWGLIYSPIVIVGNLMGGCDVTHETREFLASQYGMKPSKPCV